MLARAIVEIEEKQFEGVLERESVYYGQLVCEALYKPKMDQELRDLVMESMVSG